MVSPVKRNSLLCPNCRKLVSRSASVCPYCNLKKPGSRLNDNFFTRGLAGPDGIINAIIVCCIFMFALSLLVDMRSAVFSAHPFSFLSPSNNSLLVLGSTGTVPLFQFHRWFSLLSANYLHASLMHILFNMIALKQLAPLVVREYGGRRMVIIYTIGGVFGYVISVMAGVRFTLGASAAVCSLIGAMLYYGKSRGGIYGDDLFRQIGGWAVGIAIFGFLMPGIDNWAHGGGMLAGVILGALLGYSERRRENIFHKWLAAVCCVVTVGVLLWSSMIGVSLFIAVN